MARFFCLWCHTLSGICSSGFSREVFRTAFEPGVFVFLMARFAALYFGKQRPHALDPTSIAGAGRVGMSRLKPLEQFLCFLLRGCCLRQLVDELRDVFGRVRVLRNQGVDGRNYHQRQDYRERYSEEHNGAD